MSQGGGHSLTQEYCSLADVGCGRHATTKGDKEFSMLGWDKTLRSLRQRGEYTDICSKEERGGYSKSVG